ncbi:MAG: hypothetical protein ACOC0Q_10465 [Wenzhouxiangella sp.]
MTMLWPKGVDPQHVPGTGRGLTPADYSAMVAGITSSDRWLARQARALWDAKYINDPRARAELAAMLDLWNAQRCLMRHREIEISGRTHADLAELAVARYCTDDELTNDAAKAALRIGYDRWRRIRPIFDELVNRLAEAESLLVDHLRRQLRAPS